MKTIHVAAAVIFRTNSDGVQQILATQRGYGEFKGGWEFPGGKIEPGEAAAAAVVREIAEELSLNVEVGRLLHTVEWDYPAFHLRMFCYVCRVLAGELSLKEHVAARWLSADELQAVDWLPADVDVLPVLERFMRGI